MARAVHSRLKIRGELIAETPLHVGGYGESSETDMALARNGRDEFYIPGTSLTGSLRSWFEKNFPNEVDAIWGYQIGNNGHASFVLIEDLRLPEELQSAVQSELRDGVGIDRFYGTAANKAKFDRAILPKGTRLQFEMTVEIAARRLKPKPTDGNDKYDETEEEFTSRVAKTKVMCLLLLDALQNRNIRLGAAKTRGLGKVTLSAPEIKEELLGSSDILKALEDKKESWLALDRFQDDLLKNNTDAKKKHDELKASCSKQLIITVKWKPKSALMVKAGYEGIGVDTLPLTSGNGKDVSLVLPGSSIKGAFRAHAERIMLTMLDSADEKEIYRTKIKRNFHDQIKNIPLINELFGAKKERAGQAAHLGLGALSIDDCYAEKTFDSNVWSEVETGKMKDDESYTAQPLWKALKKIDGDENDDSTTFKISHHVAIDRWTGGASEGALYSVLQPTQTIKWDDIRLTLDLSRLRKADGSPDESLQKRCLMLLLLVLRDFAENRLPLGFATNRGMGEVEKVSFKTSGAYDIEWKDGKFDFKKPTDLESDLRTEWITWLNEN